MLLIGGLGTLVALSRAGSTLFWRVGLDQLDSAELDYGRLCACLGLLLLSPLLVLLAAPVLEYLAATVSQLHDLAAYRQTLQAGGGL
ncbi:putative monovalent cation/H+ antiporter subunit D [compost metagenome]